MTKVLRVITRLNIGGPALHAVLLTRELSRYGYETVLVAGRCEAGEGDMSYILRAGDPVVWVPEMSRSVRPANNLRALLQLYRIMRRESPLIVHTHTAMAGCLGRLAASLARVPIIIHTFHGNSLSNYFSGPSSWVFRQIERLLAWVTDCICAVSPQQVEELSDRFRIAPRSKFRVVALGLELEPCKAVPAPDQLDGPLTVGWIGRLVPVKGIPLLISVIEETLRRSEQVRFLIAGDGPERRSLQAAVQRFGEQKVEWLGWQQDIVPALSRCHLLVQTSRNEGTPVALIQGMAAGRAFVSTPVGGIVDMAEGPVLRLEAGGRWFSNCVLVDPDPASFADVLLRFVGDRRLVAEMGLAARAFATREYAKERLIRDVTALYQELIQAKCPDALLESRPRVHPCGS